jgi:DTW domain-containing protein YfiP
MRSVVLKPTPRCARCQLPPRWCICAAHRDIRCPLQIDVLMQRRERFRPSSTGNLIDRVFPESRLHLWSHERQPTAAEVTIPSRDVWILHPHGRPAPAGVEAGSIQLILLDGSWSETSAMARAVTPWGRLVSLPMTGESRFWLRDQQEGGRFSTAEALLFVLDALGLHPQHEELRVQFELHVYASLRARGRTEAAAEFLAGSIIATALPELLAQLHTRRPR